MIKGNDNNVYLNVVCLLEMCKDWEYKIKMVFFFCVEILYVEDGCFVGRGFIGSCKYIVVFCYVFEEFVRLGFIWFFLFCMLCL